MLQAGREGLTRGDYAFFYIDIFGASLQGSRFPEPQRPWKRGDRHDASARQAFEVSPGLCTGTHRAHVCMCAHHARVCTGTHPRVRTPARGAGPRWAPEQPPSPPARSPLLAATEEEGNEINGPGSQLRRCLEQRLLIGAAERQAAPARSLGPRPRGDRAGSPSPAGSSRPRCELLSLISGRHHHHLPGAQKSRVPALPGTAEGGGARPLQLLHEGRLGGTRGWSRESWGAQG